MTKNTKESLITISADSFIKNSLFAMALALKLFLCINGKIFDFKETQFRYYGPSLE